jgi:hypothetical protein
MLKAMAAPWGSVPRKRLIENITLLWTLNKIIEPPRENVLHDDEKSWRQLPIEHEKTIADLLAFLSATRDDNCKITAVCIEESRDHDHLTIRLSSNTGDLVHVKDGFENIARILEKASGRGTERS